MSWPTVALSDVCEINVGRTPARANPAFWGPGQSWLSIADMNQGRLIQHTKEQITQLAAKACKLVEPGTVLLSFKLSIGKVGIAARPVFTNEAIAALPIKRPDLLHTEYLAYALDALDLGHGSNRAAMGATLNKAKLREIQIPLPPLVEQRRIAAILDEADALRAKRRQTLALLDDLTQSIFLDMFGNRTFLCMKFGDLIQDMRNGLSPSRSGTVEARVLTLSAVTGGTFDAAASKAALFDRQPPAAARVDRNDLLICRGNGNLGLVGSAVWSERDHCELVFPDTVIAARVLAAEVGMPYLVAAWRQRSTRRQIESLSRTTSGIHKVNPSDLGIDRGSPATNGPSRRVRCPDGKARTPPSQGAQRGLRAG